MRHPRHECHARRVLKIESGGSFERGERVSITPARGFEKFIGKPSESVPRLISRVCSLCPIAHALALIIGIFCMEVFPYEGLIQIVEEDAGRRREAVKMMEVAKGRFPVSMGRGAPLFCPSLGDPEVRAAGIPGSLRFRRKPCRYLVRFGGSLWERALAAGSF
ncbi:MAG: hypothetical protein METHP_01869 [Methanoregula sp. SKADARSKE-2]|nr:MAG: hypothetical protein METHP_01869 [Methanoregula sp. SKADARSKE-2]